jgi:MFS family permease
LREPGFRRLVGGFAVSQVAVQMYFVALPWVALEQGSPTAAGLLLATAAVPRALLMLPGGVLIDRLGGRRVMLGSDLARTAVMALAATVAFAGRLELGGLFVVAALFGAADAFFQPAPGAVTADVVDRQLLPAANAVRTLAGRMAQLVGPLVGALVVGTGGIAWVLAADAGLFGASVLLLWRMPRRPAGRTEGGAARAGREGFGAAIGTGLRYAATHPTLGAVLLLSVVVNLGLAAPVNVGLVLLARDGGWGVRGLGLLFAGLGVGATAAAVVVALGRVPRAGTGGLMLGATVVQGCGVAATPFVPWLPAAVAIQAVLGAAAMVGANSAVSVVQAASDDALRGRIMSLMSLSMFGLTPVAYALAGVVATSHGVVALFVAGGLIQLVAGLGGLLWSPLRTANVLVPARGGTGNYTRRGAGP